jgi:hypothetical protein
MKILKHFRTSISSSSSVRMKTRFGAKDSLITNELVSAHPADAGQSRFDFVPLKGQHMANAKHLRKRIALVAAAALGVGMLAAAPAFATSTALTMTLGTATPTIPVVSTAVRIPLLLQNTATGTDTAGSVNYTVTVNSVPNNSAITTTSFTSDITGLDATLLGTGKVTMTAPTNALLATIAINSANVGPVAAGGFSFTPDVPGSYSLTIAAALTAATSTQTAVTAIIINVGGAAATQATSGLGTTSSTQTVGNLSSFIFNVPATTAVSSQYQVSATGATINAAGYGAANLGAGVSTWTPTTGIVKTNGTDYTQGFTFTTQQLTTNNVLTGAAKMDQISVTVSASAAGTATITAKSVNPITGVLTTVGTQTITFVGSGSTAVSVSNTLIYKAAGVTAPTSVTDPTAITSAMTAQTLAANAAANILVAPKDGNGSTLASETITAVVTGPGMLGIATTQAGSTASGRALTGTAGQYYINVFGDGTAGVATITISDGTVTLGTKSVTFFGALAKYTTASTAKTDLGVAETEALTYTGLDAAGNAATLGTLYVSSSATTVATVTVSGGVVTITGVAPGTANITIGNAATSPTISTVVAVTVTKTTAKTVTMSFDKASYAPGAVMVLTVKAVDANGAAVADGTRTLFSAAGVTSNVGLTGTLPGSTVALVGGVLAYTLYAPLVGGTVNLTGTEGAGTDNVIAGGTAAAITASATVAGGTGGGLSAADSAAIAAAKAAADAATAAVATLSTTVASLIASITAQIRALSAQIAKLFAKSGGSTPGLPKTGAKKK